MLKDAQVPEDTHRPARHPGVTLWKESVSGRKLSPAARPGYHRGRRPGNAGKRYAVTLLTPAEVRRLLEACPDTSVGNRNRALIAVLYRSGLRLSEALTLHTQDLDLVRGTIFVRNGKGGKRRIAAIDSDGQRHLQHWLAVRDGLGLGTATPVFCTSRGSTLKTSYVRSLLPRLAHAAGIKKRVHAHGLRHSHAAELAREGIPLHLIQRQLGHTNLATTDTYLRGISSEDLVAAIQTRHWGR